MSTTTILSELHIILGPMFAGKSTYIINKFNDLAINKQIKNETILLINHSSDSRYDTNKICNHNGIKIDCKTASNLSELFNNIQNTTTWDNIHYILIDESQFFNDLYDVVKTLLQMPNKQIYIAGLDGDFKQEPFHNSKILNLIPYATSVTKLTAKCYICNHIAPFSKRLTNINQTILIGGSETYQPACINHLHS